METKTSAIGAALIAASATVVAAVIGVVGSRDDAAPAPQVPSPNTASTTATGTKFQQLLSYLPEQIANCRPAATPIMALAAAECTAAPSGRAAGAGFFIAQYPDADHARQDFATRVPAEVEVTGQDCPNGPDRSDYQIPAEGMAGLLACWVAVDQRPYVVWTRDSAGIVAVAGGPVDGSLQDLWPIWLNARIRGDAPTP